LEPKRGLLVKTNDNHIGVVSSVSETHIHIKECNYIPNKCSERELPRNDKTINGYLPPPKPNTEK